MKQFKRLGVIGRWKPLHNGGAALLGALCEQAEHVLIGVGSADGAGISYKYNARNPFTPSESEEMIRRVLSPKFNNYEFIRVPDFAHHPAFRDGQKWRAYVLEHFGELNAFASGNAYVKELLQNDYRIINAWEFVPEEKRAPIKAAMVRLAMAKGEDITGLVPKQVADYLENGLIERFRKEFGLETLAGMIDKSYFRPESKNEEKIHTYEA